MIWAPGPQPLAEHPDDHEAGNGQTGRFQPWGDPSVDTVTGKLCFDWHPSCPMTYSQVRSAAFRLRASSQRSQREHALDLSTSRRVSKPNDHARQIEESSISEKLATGTDNPERAARIYH